MALRKPQYNISSYTTLINITSIWKNSHLKRKFWRKLHNIFKMALRFKGKHHRNPSGLHAKVIWFIQESKWDLAKIEDLYKKVTTNIVHLSEDNEIDWKSTRNSLRSWDKAISICEFIITGSIRPSYKKIELDDVKNKHWFIKLKDYYDTYISNNAITKEYFI